MNDATSTQAGETASRGRAKANEGLGVYVHVPFCDRVCPYCDFAVVGVGALAPAREAAYVDALLAELRLFDERLGAALADRRLETLYFGGGTPSLLTPDSLARLIEALRARFPGEPAEVTLELNPGRLECARLPGFRAAGITRVSLGVQSLDALTLKRLGRAHGPDAAARGLDACLEAGFDSVSADLIYGAPDQTRDSLARDLDALCERALPHVSAYALTLEPATPFFAAAQKGRLALPDEDTVVAMSDQVCGRLSDGGLERYEISSFARPGHRSRHNQRYWLREDVLGLGVSAASLIGDERLQNVRSTDEWQRRIGLGELALGETERLDERQVRREAIFLGFRRIEGVDVAAFERRFGAPPAHFFATEIAELTRLGLIDATPARLRLTEKGLLFADEVGLRFA